MTSVTVKFTLPELELLATLASDQLFRREFIDPKMPGHKPGSGDVKSGRALVARLQSALDSARRKAK